MSTIKPPNGWVLNSDHAYANGLVGAWIWNEGSGQITRDLTNISGVCTASGWTLVWGTNADGQMEVTGDASDSTVFTVANNVIATLAQPCTVIAKVRINGINETVLSISSSSTGGDQHCIRTKTGNFLTAASRNGGGGFVEAVTGTARAAPTLVTVAAVFNGLSSRILYANGFSEASNSSPVTDLAINRTEIGRLGDSTPNGSWAGGFEYVFLYNRALDGTEILNISGGPYAMMQEPVQRLDSRANFRLGLW